jgi:hypothetical protein
VETLLVDPASGDVLLVARAPGGRAPLFRAAAAALDAETVPLEAAGYLTVPGEDTARGGAVALSREAVALRTTRGLLLYALPPGATLLQGLEGTPCALPVGPEVQGEAVTFGPGGDYFTLGEGTRPTLYRARRKGAP